MNLPTHKDDLWPRLGAVQPFDIYDPASVRKYVDNARRLLKLGLVEPYHKMSKRDRIQMLTDYMKDALDVLAYKEPQR